MGLGKGGGEVVRDGEGEREVGRDGGGEGESIGLCSGRGQYGGGGGEGKVDGGAWGELMLGNMELEGERCWLGDRGGDGWGMGSTDYMHAPWTVPPPGLHPPTPKYNIY